MHHTTNRAYTCAARSNSYVRGLCPTLTRSCRRVDLERIARLHTAMQGCAVPPHVHGTPLVMRTAGWTDEYARRAIPLHAIHPARIPAKYTLPRTTTLAIRTPVAGAMRESSAPWTAPSPLRIARIRSVTPHARVRPASTRSAAALLRTYNSTHLRSHFPQVRA
ncbi:hypothetical protein C8R44DRAFT_895159 [Mycena epipterygia]|nr:hypothetical protein C8R44DRAFT_895159 [Mycena epipterygia]